MYKINKKVKKYNIWYLHCKGMTIYSCYKDLQYGKNKEKRKIFPDTRNCHSGLDLTNPAAMYNMIIKSLDFIVTA